MRYALIGFVSLVIGCGCGTSAQAQVSSAEYAKALYAEADDILDDARTAPAGATEKLDSVLGRLETAITKYPDNALLQTAMGRALILRDCAFQGNNCSLRAKGHLTRAIELDPKVLRAHVLLAHDAMNSGCLPCARPHILAASRIEPSNPYVLEVTARSVQLYGNRNEAEKGYLQAIDGFPTPKKRWQAYTWLSEIYKNPGDFKRAEETLLKARDSAPEGAWSNGNLGTYYIFARGEYDKAIPVLRKTVSIMSYGLAQEALALSLYERWADAYLRKAGPGTVRAYWEEAQGQSSDVQTMFFTSATYAGTGRAARALLETKQVPRTVLEQEWGRGTPLLLAAYNDNTDLAVYLIGQGANPNTVSRNGIFVAHVAGSWGDFKILKALAGRNANLKALTQEARETALMQVAKVGTGKPDRIKAAALLIDKGVPLEAKSVRGSTALSYAIGARDVEMVRYLLRRGARVNGEIGDGLTSTALAILVDDRDILQALIGKKADLNAKVSGLTLLEYAEKNGRPEMADMLRSRGQMQR